MHTTVRLLDEWKQALGIESDYALAKHLGVHKQAISRYRTGEGALGDDMAIRIADELGLDRGYVLACMSAERAKRTDTRQAWEALARKAGVAATVLVFLGFLATILDLSGAAAALVGYLSITVPVIHYPHFGPAVGLPVALFAAWLIARALGPLPDPIDPGAS